LPSSTCLSVMRLLLGFELMFELVEVNARH
jgi:hypothetical protein